MGWWQERQQRVTESRAGAVDRLIAEHRAAQDARFAELRTALGAHFDALDARLGRLSGEARELELLAERIGEQVSQQG